MNASLPASVPACLLASFLDCLLAGVVAFCRGTVQVCLRASISGFTCDCLQA
jgi:hypothetical protein